ncbi:hypothetical protein NRB_06730 [Novosphingobium sp. 11B]
MTDMDAKNDQYGSFSKCVSAKDDDEFLAAWVATETAKTFTDPLEVDLVHLGWLMARADAEERLSRRLLGPSTPVR